jgi:hypothetical protein
VVVVRLVGSITALRPVAGTGARGLVPEAAVTSTSASRSRQLGVDVAAQRRQAHDVVLGLVADLLGGGLGGSDLLGLGLGLLAQPVGPRVAAACSCSVSARVASSWSEICCSRSCARQPGGRRLVSCAARDQLLLDLVPMLLGLGTGLLRRPTDS